MRFHHSTRRGKRSNYKSVLRNGHSKLLSRSRLQQIAYCKETNIYFERPVLIELPEALRRQQMQPRQLSASDLSPQQLSHATPAAVSQPTPMIYDAATAAAVADDLLVESAKRQILSLTPQKQASRPMAAADHNQQQIQSNSVGDLNSAVENNQHLPTSSAAALLLSSNEASSILVTTANDCSLEDCGEYLLREKLHSCHIATPTSDENFITSLNSYEKERFSKRNNDTNSKINNENKQELLAAKQQASKQLKSSMKSSKNQAATNCNHDSSADECGDDFIASIRQSLIAQVEKHPFWSKKAARRMQLRHVDKRRVLVCELSSFCERREVEWRFVAYTGGLMQSVPFRRSTVDYSKLPSSSSQLQHLNTTKHKASVRLDSQGSEQQTPDSSTSQSPFDNSKADWHHFAGSRRLSLINTASCSSQTQLSKGQFDLLSNPENFSIPIVYKKEEPSPEELWSLEPEIKPTTSFEPCVSYCEVPNSSHVRQCHCCDGKGRLKCNTCHGVGYEVCTACSGQGGNKTSVASASRPESYDSKRDYPSDADSSPFSHYKSNTSRTYDYPSSSKFETCLSCDGSGRKRCWICTGRSYNTCPACCGAGSLRRFMRLIVSWQTHKDETFLNNSDKIVPIDRLKLCNGKTIVEEIDKRELLPLYTREHFLPTIQSSPTPPDDILAVHTACRKLLDKHRKLLNQQKLIRQRCRVVEYNCDVVQFEYKLRKGQFVIYGEEKKVYVPKYPFKTLPHCSIL